MKKPLAHVVVLLSLSGACVHPKPNESGATLSAEEAAKRTATIQASTLGTGDLVEVRVFQEPDLSNAYRVSPEGTIDFPLCGKVPISGMTSSQAADALTHCLANGFLKRPQVSVLIREYNSKKVFIFGEVQKPGTFPYEENMTIIQAVTLAGGFTKLASKNNLNVTRIIDGVEQKIRIAAQDIGVGREKNFTLQPGDIVYVPESFF
ncbi:MAG: polysaccharide biosynthesis/export family protein [Myxococcota bacterium]